MNNKHSSFGKKVFNNTTFALFDLLLTKIGTTLVFILLARLLPERDIAAVGISMGYLVLVAYLDVGPIRVLLRDYPRIAADRNERDQLLTALFLFWGLQAVAMLALCFGLQSFVLSSLDIPGLPFLFFSMTMDFIALSFREWIRKIFYTDFQQRVATTIGFIVTLARLACYGLLLFWPSLDNYAWILITTSFANCIVWGIVFQQRFHFRPIFNRRIPVILKQSLSSYGLWDHFNRMVLDTLFTIDTVVLSWFAFGQLRDIGNYTIALKVTSLLFLIPMQLHLSLQVVLSNYNEGGKRLEAINTFIKANALISFAQLLFVFVSGNWFIHLLFGADIDIDVIRFTTIIAVGVTIINLGLPLISIINNLCSLRQAFFLVFLPALVFGCAIYIGAASQWGAIGMAYGNIVAYAILVAGLVIFTSWHYPFSLNLQLITPEEKRLFRELVRGLY